MSSQREREQPLRVLQVTQFLDLGGLESLVIGQCRQLKKNGIAVELLCLHEVDENYERALRKDNIPVHVIPEKSWFNITFFRQVSGLIRKKKFDIVHAHSGCHLNIALFSRKAGARLFYTAHGLPMFTGLRDRLEDSLAAFFTANVVAVSDEIEKFLKQWFWFPRCQFNTILNGIDTNIFRPIIDPDRRTNLLNKYQLPENRILFGSVGRLEAVKNYAMALHAIRRLVDAGFTNISFVLVGEGGQEQYLKALVKELNISEYVRFLGRQYNIHEILPLFRFFILSSLTEGTSISLLESQACAIPAVVTDVGGNSKVITHTENGFLCPSGDAKKMAEYMRSLIENPDMAEIMGATARDRVVRNFSIESMAQQYIQLYSTKE